MDFAQFKKAAGEFLDALEGRDLELMKIIVQIERARDAQRFIQSHLDEFSPETREGILQVSFAREIAKQDEEYEDLKRDFLLFCEAVGEEDVRHSTRDKMWRFINHCFKKNYDLETFERVLDELGY